MASAKKKKPFVSVIIVAAGSGTRMGANKNKLLLSLSGKSILARTLDKFEENENICEIIIASSQTDLSEFYNIIKTEGYKKIKSVVIGGVTRQDSVKNCLEDVSQNADIVLVHDGARALVSHKIINESINTATEFGGAVCAVKVTDTLKESDEEGFVSKTLNRQITWSIQTPQAFSFDILRASYEKAYQDGFLATDDCALVERLGYKVKLFEGSYSNIKITTKEDLFIAESLLSSL